MSTSMNIHRVGNIELSEIKALTLDNGTVFYTRQITITDMDGQVVIYLNPMSDNGHNLLIEDGELLSMKEEPLRMAA